MIEAPFLTIAEVRQEVERIVRSKHRSTLVALYGRGEPGELELAGQRWRVVPTRCELELREHMPPPGEERTGYSVYLVDWVADILPLDVACRLAKGRLFHVARDARLAALFGARQVESGLAHTALAKLFLSGAVPPPRKVPGLQLTHAAAWASLLESRFRLTDAALASVGTLLAWASTHEGGPSFARQADAEDLWRNVRRELTEWLRASLGDAAVVVWQAWELGLGGRLLEVLPLLGAGRSSGDAYLAGQVSGHLGVWLSSTMAPTVRAVEGLLVDDGVLDAALPRERDALIRTMERSEALAHEADLGAVTEASGRLPGGHRARERALARATESFLAGPSIERALTVVEALRHLEAHALDVHLRAEEHRTARKNLGRLTLWLAGRDASAPPQGTRWQPAVDLARRYAEEGGFLEWGRQQLRGLRGADEALIRAARTLEAAAGSALRDDHRTFAEAYVSWLEAGKPSAAALPIEDVGKQVITPFLKGGQGRKLLVVLMDGLSHAAAVQLLSRLGQTRHWFPIAWRREGWHGALPLPPVLAVAPTLTQLSRGAFFAGKADPRFGNEGTDKDPLRWKTNKALADVLSEEAPPLFVRRDILSGHDLARDIREAIQSECRAVAVVVNAVDEELKGSIQVARDYSVAQIHPLETLLSAAEESERVVLLVADHGHVLGDGTRILEGRLDRDRPGGARWRALAEGEEPRADEVVLPKTAWVPRGWDRVAVLWDPAVVNKSASYGEHGGLSLAEVVAPALLIAPEWLERGLPDDSDVAMRPLPTPDWWDLRARRPVERPARSAPKRPVPSAQVPLFGPTPEPIAPPAPPASPAIVASLRRSAVFQSHTQGQPAAEIERVLSWLAILVDAGGSLPAHEFAAAAAVRAHQVAGVVARMGVLNADGFAMVEHDHVGRRVVLHRARLVQHYGIKE
jgi:hypothetical protein